LNAVKSEGCRDVAQRRRAEIKLRFKLRLGKPAKSEDGLCSTKFLYVYILQSESNPERFYVGLTENLHSRLKKHNAGEVIPTSKFRPWRIKTAIAFTDMERATQFERYLKTASGRAFAKKRL
jgi:predicted GIY-YIG superfamily endonuclease